MKLHCVDMDGCPADQGISQDNAASQYAAVPQDEAGPQYEAVVCSISVVLEHAICIASV